MYHCRLLAAMWKFRIACLAVLAFSALSESEKLTVGIVHYNDVHGQLFPFKKNTNPPEMCVHGDENCVGGIRELAGHIKNIKATRGTHLSADFVIATGNLISGNNGWLSLLNGVSSWSNYGDLIRSTAIDEVFGRTNYYEPNFLALGLREFDGGVSLLNTYLGHDGNVKTRVILSNLNCQDARLVDEQRFCSLVDPFRIVNVTDYKIGIIGFIDPKVVHLADPGTLEVENTIASLKSIVENYLSDVSAIIAIGSGSLELVKSIADEIEKVKLVIYANDEDKEQDQVYPLQYNQKIIAKAGMYGSSVGNLVVDIETTTGLITVNDATNLVEVDNSTSPDAYLKDKMDNFNSTLNQARNKKISTAKVTIDGRKENCWTKQCTLGDLVADSMVNCVFQNLSLNVPADLISVWHAGGLGDVQLKRRDDITTIDAYKLLPYSHAATLVTVTGLTLRKMFTQSATALDSSPPFQWGQFLQVSSGIQVHYTVENGMTTVSSLRTVRIDSEGNKLKFENVEDSSFYYLVIPSVLYNGHNAYWDLPGSFISGSGFADHLFVGSAHDCLKNYLDKIGVMKLGIESRITAN